MSALVSRLLEALRKQPNVRLAMLYGSVARGSEGLTATSTSSSVSAG